LAPTYAPDLHVVGVVAAAPATNLSVILSFLGKPAGQLILPFLLEAGWSWVNTYRDLPASVMFSPGGLVQAPALNAGCLGDTAARIRSQQAQATAIFLPGASTAPAVVAHAQLNDPGRVRMAAPILVVQGSADTTVPPALTDLFMQKMACPIGDTIDDLRYTGATHGSIPIVAASQILSWMSDRLAGAPAPSTCSLPGLLRTVSS